MHGRLLILAVALAVAACVAGGGRLRPGVLIPLDPLAIDDPPDRLTSARLARLDDDPQQCLATLALSGADAAPVPDRQTSGDCGWTNAVNVRRSSFRPRTPFVLSCRATVSLLLWERHVVTPAALETLGEPVVGYDHFGSFACRPVAGREFGQLSRHARADALDISAFVLRSGRRVSVLRGWTSGDVAEMAFLKQVKDGACAYFDVVLSPEHDAAHANHFHLDRGSSRLCR